MNDETLLPIDEAAETGGEPVTQPAAAQLNAEPAGEPAAPNDLLDRIANHPDLTPAMRQRLSELVQRQPPEVGPTQVPLDDVLAILAEAIPSQLRLSAGELPIAPHPEGESFFTGYSARDADKQAAAVASEQLALSGLLRKP